MTPKSPLMKALVGKQKNLPEALKAKILAAPESPAKQTMGPKPKKKVRSGEELTGKKATKTFKGGPLGPYKPAPKSPAKMAMKKSPAKIKDGKMPMTKVDGKNVPAFAADGKGKNDLAKTPAKMAMKKTPAKMGHAGKKMKK